MGLWSDCPEHIPCVADAVAAEVYNQVTAKRGGVTDGNPTGRATSGEKMAAAVLTLAASGGKAGVVLLSGPTGPWWISPGDCRARLRWPRAEVATCGLLP